MSSTLKTKEMPEMGGGGRLPAFLYEILPPLYLSYLTTRGIAAHVVGSRFEYKSAPVVL